MLQNLVVTKAKLQRRTKGQPSSAFGYDEPVPVVSDQPTFQRRV